RGAVALLADDQLGLAFEAFVGLGIDRAIVELLPIDETHHVGVLLDGPGLAQVGELGAAVLAAALLGGAGQLGQRDHRDVELFGQRLERAGDVGDLLLAVFGIGR